MCLGCCGHCRCVISISLSLSIFNEPKTKPYTDRSESNEYDFISKCREKKNFDIDNETQQKKNRKNEMKLTLVQHYKYRDEEK